MIMAASLFLNQIELLIDRLGSTDIGPAQSKLGESMKQVAINGFGRIGRNVVRALIETPRDDFQIVAINDLAPAETAAPCESR